MLKRTKAEEATFQKRKAALKGIARKRMAEMLSVPPREAAQMLYGKLALEMGDGAVLSWFTAKMDLFDYARRAGIGLRTRKVQAIVAALKAL